MSPRRQLGHSPQKTVESKVTRSPILNVETEEPRAAMTPAASWPMTRGGMRRPVLPSKPWTSLPQMPQAATWMRTSSGEGSGFGVSVISRWLYWERRRDFIFLVARVAGSLARFGGCGAIEGWGRSKRVANGRIEERFLTARADAFAQKRTRRKGVGSLPS